MKIRVNRWTSIQRAVWQSESERRRRMRKKIEEGGRSARSNSNLVVEPMRVHGLDVR
jgi:uncharacterized protein (DUF2461 family)